MAVGNPYRPSYGTNDWTSRLPPGAPSADPGMAVQPYVDPGYGMPNAYVGNLNQAPGQVVGGYLPVNQLIRPADYTDETMPQNRLAPWSNFEGDGGALSNDYWLEQARRLAANPNDYGRPEPLPGITSGAPRYGQDTSQLHWQRPPTWTQQLGASRPADYTVDPRMPTNVPAPPSFKVWRGGRASLPSSAASPDTGEFWAERWRLPPPREQTD